MGMRVWVGLASRANRVKMNRSRVAVVVAAVLVVAVVVAAMLVVVRGVPASWKPGRQWATQEFDTCRVQ
jgi:hypothetical protein